MNKKAEINRLENAKTERFKTQWNAKNTVIGFIEGNQEDIKLFPEKYEVNTQPSKTVPDQSLSVQEILRRYARGLPLSDVKTPIYEGEETYHPDLSKMDLADREAYLDEQVEKLRLLKQDLKARSEEIKKNREETTKKQKEAEKKALIDEIERSKRTGLPMNKQNRDVEDI
jgi:hypothetical protein